MKSPFGKKSDALKKLSPVAKKETCFKPKDVAILRECLAGLHKKAPPILQKKIVDALLGFAESVKEYCLHDEQVYVEHEKKYACLNCGNRSKNKGGDPKLVKG